MRNGKYCFGASPAQERHTKVDQDHIARAYDWAVTILSNTR